MTWLAGSVVVASGLWLVGLALAIVAVPARAERFLGKFASSARAHYTEQVLRLLAGSAIVVFSSEMRFPEAFRAFGWLLGITAAGLILLPWRWHQRFGERVIPLAIRHMKLYALAAFVLGALILYSALPRSVLPR